MELSGLLADQLELKRGRMLVAGRLILREISHLLKYGYSFRESGDKGSGSGASSATCEAGGQIFRNGIPA